MHADVLVSVQPFCDSDESEGCESVFSLPLLPLHSGMPAAFMSVLKY